MGAVVIDVVVDFRSSPKRVWDALVDRKGHEGWVPATRVEFDDPADQDVGSTFTAWTGFRPLRLEDRMRVTKLVWDDTTESGESDLEKLGPVLFGRAGFTVTAHEGGARVEWLEDVTIAQLPGVLSRPASMIAAVGFKLALRRLERRLARPARTPDQ